MVFPLTKCSCYNISSEMNCDDPWWPCDLGRLQSKGSCTQRVKKGENLARLWWWKHWPTDILYYTIFSPFSPISFNRNKVNKTGNGRRRKPNSVDKTWPNIPLTTVNTIKFKSLWLKGFPCSSEKLKWKWSDWKNIQWRQHSQFTIT